MKLTDLFAPKNVVTDMPPAGKEALIEAMVSDLDAKGYIADRAQANRDILAREKVMSTGIGNGVAIPHAYTDAVERLVAGFYRTREGVDFAALDRRNVDLFFIILGPKRNRPDHIKVLAKISRLLNHEEFRDHLRGASDVQAVLNVFRRYGDR